MATLAALGLRLLFLFRFPAVTTDSLVYGDIAKNWLQHGIYGLSGPDEISPTYIRLPGYPAFLAAVFAIFGMEHYRAVAGAADVRGHRHLFPDRGHRAPNGFGAGREGGVSVGGALSISGQLCGRRFDRDAGDIFHRSGVRLRHRRAGELEERRVRPWLGCGLAIGAAILLRPDGGLLLIAIELYLALVVGACLERARRGRVARGHTFLSLIALVRAGLWRCRLVGAAGSLGLAQSAYHASLPAAGAALCQ